MDNKLITICITLVVGVILAGSVLMPVLNEATTTQKAFQNDGYYSMDVVKADPNETITIFFDHTAPRVIYVDDVEITMPKQTVTIVGSDATMVRYSYGTDERASVQMYIGETTSGVYADSWNNQDMTITIAEGTITGSNGTITKDATPTSDIYCISGNGGELVMKPYSESAYLKGDSEFVAIGRTAIGETNVCLYAEGTILGGVPDVDVFYEAAETTTDNVEIHATAINGYINLYSFDNFTFDMTQNGVTVSATYSAIIIPAEVTAELANHMTPGEIALMNAIPIMVIIALVMVALGGIYFGRRD